MPFKLRKAPRRELYWVVNTETQRKYSGDPIPRTKAERQLKILQQAELRGVQGGATTRYDEEGDPYAHAGFETVTDSEAKRRLDLAVKRGTVVRPTATAMSFRKDGDTLSFDEAKYKSLMKGLLPREDFDFYNRRRGAAAFAGGWNPQQTYEQYKRDFERNARARATTNELATARKEMYVELLQDRNRKMEQYYKQNPDERTARTRYDENGNLIPHNGTELVPLYEAKRRATLANKDNSFFGKLMDGLTAVGDVAADFVPVLGDVYKATRGGGLVPRIKSKR